MRLAEADRRLDGGSDVTSALALGTGLRPLAVRPLDLTRGAVNDVNGGAGHKWCVRRPA